MFKTKREMMGKVVRFLYRYKRVDDTCRFGNGCEGQLGTIIAISIWSCRFTLPELDGKHPTHHGGVCNIGK